LPLLFTSTTDDLRLGRAYALLFGRLGARVVVNDLKDPSSVVSEIRNAGGHAFGVINSVSEGEQIVAKTIQHYGRIDAVVNNAGFVRDKSIANMTDVLWDSIMDVHLTALYKVTKAAWPHFVRQGYGRIVNVSSTSGIYGNFGQSNYSLAVSLHQNGSKFPMSSPFAAEMCYHWYLGITGSGRSTTQYSRKRCCPGCFNPRTCKCYRWEQHGDSSSVLSAHGCLALLRCLTSHWQPFRNWRWLACSNKVASKPRSSMAVLRSFRCRDNIRCPRPAHRLRNHFCFIPWRTNLDGS
jgi:hypothetical protein